VPAASRTIAGTGNTSFYAQEDDTGQGSDIPWYWRVGRLKRLVNRTVLCPATE
jgi:hypothetical protein